MSNNLPASDEPNRKPATEWQLRLRQFFAQGWVEVGIGVLVVVSVALTMFEFSLESSFASGADRVTTLIGEMTPMHLSRMEMINEIITFIFVVELTLRFLAAASKKRFFSEFWIDILATIPVFRVFRSARAFRLLRLIRVIRLLGVISRLSSHYPYIIRRGAADFLMICTLLLVAVTFGTVAMTHFERQRVSKIVERMEGETTSDGVALDRAEEANEVSEAEVGESDGDEEFDLDNSFWFSLYTLFAGEPIPATPRTFVGKLVSVFLMFMGLTIFAIFTGTVSAFMVDRLRVEGRIVEFDELYNHIVICGWTPKTEVIIREYRAGKKTRRTPIVVVTEIPSEQLEAVARQLTGVLFIHDDFTKAEALERAGIAHAQSCLVLSDTHGGRSEQDADARTLLAALSVEKMNEKVYTCAELNNRSYATHLHLGKVNDFVVSSEYGAHMLAQAAMKRGLLNVVSELLTYERGNEFYRVDVPETWVGQSFDEKLSDVRNSMNIILIAVHSRGQDAIVNPENYRFQRDDEVVVISRHEPKLV